MSEGNRSGAGRYVRVVASLVVTLGLVGCGGWGLLPRKADIKNTNFRSYAAVEAAYHTISPGATKESELSQIGFDAAESPNVEILSYLGVIERFMPRDSIKFDQLDPAVQNCIGARDHCSAYIFKPERIHEERTGSWFLDVLGFERESISYGWSAEVMLLVQDGRVVYKVMGGRPRINDYHDDIEPLGPFQDLRTSVLASARF